MSIHEVKLEPLREEAEEVHEDLDDDIIKGVEDTSSFFFDNEEEDKTSPIKEEIKEEIKYEPLDKDNLDPESHVIDVENDQEKSDLKAMVDKLLLEKQTLQKDIYKLIELQVDNQILKFDKNNLERQLEDKGKKFEELRVETQNLKSDKNYVERQIEDKVKALEHKVNNLQVKNQNLREQLQLNSNLITPLKEIKKSDVAQNMEIPEEEPVCFPSKEINFSDLEVSSNCNSNSGANQVAFEELYQLLTKSDSSIIINEKRTPRSTRKLIRYDEDQLDDISSDSGSDKNYCMAKDRTEDETQNDEVSDMEDFQEKIKHTTKKLDSIVTLKGKNISSQRKTVNGKQRYSKCKICGREFGPKGDLNRHIKTVHKKQKDYKCESCGKSFGQNISLNIHIKTVHERQRDFKCESCGKFFGQKNHLNSHIKTVHEKQRDYKCHICGKAFGGKKDLNIHIKIVHEKQRYSKCKICGREFGLKTDLNRHIKTVHEKQKDYKCKSCGKSFGQNTTLNIHIKTVHEQQRYYKCESCDKFFGIKANLRVHTESIHKKKIQM